MELDIHQEISAESQAELLLDFNVAESIIASGSGDFSLEPEVTTVADAETGIQGHLSLPLSGIIMIRNQAGQIVYSTYTNGSGAFLIRGVAEGSYDVLVQVSGQGQVVSGIELPSQPVEINIDNVTVVSGEITQMGTIEI